MINSGKYTMEYVAKMAKVSRQTLHNWKKNLPTKTTICYLTFYFLCQMIV